ARYDDDLFGLYATERKAKNALARIAKRANVSEAMLGLREAHEIRERAAPSYDSTGGDAGRDLRPLWNMSGDSSARNSGSTHADLRAQHLVRFLTAIAPTRLQSWPYRGPIAVREGKKVHVFDAWTHLGSVSAGSD